MARRFLYLTNSHLVSLAARGTRIVEREEFAVADGANEAFERHVKGMRDVPTHVIVDLAEEDFRLDTIPHVGGRDRDAMLSRKVSQLFRATPYRHATLQGRDTEGRRDDRVLYSAIINPEVLQPWIDALERVKIPIAGIHSAATIGGALLAELGLVFPHTLLVSFSPGGAIRQTYFRRAELRFSRLTPMDLHEGQGLGELLNEETSRTWQYLDSQRNFTEQDHLEVCVLVHPKDRPSVEPQLRDLGQIRYRLLDIEQVAGKLGMKPPPLTSSAETILTHLFLRRPTANQYASGEIRRNAVLRTARRVISAVSIAVLAAGVIGGGYIFSRVVSTDSESIARSRQLDAVNREFESIRRALPTEGVGGTAMREAVAFYNANLRNHPSVVEFLVPLTRVLQAHAGIRVIQVAWQTAADPLATPSMAATAMREAAPVKSVRQGAGAAPAVPGEPADTPFTSRRHQVALLEGAVRVSGTEFRAALAEVERLVAALGAVPGYKAEVVDRPLDTRPGAAVQGRLDERSAAISEARFTVRLSRESRASP